MSTLEKNNLIRFKSITRNKDGVLFANFKAQGMKGATTFAASITVDISSLDNIDPTDSMEKIIEEAARMASKEFKRSDLQFEGITAL